MSFSEDIKRQVWDKARTEPGLDENMFRKDACGAWIMWEKYGNRENVFGWEIDHVFPVRLGGDDNIENLRALHCLNNASKGDDYPSYMAAVTAEGYDNIRKKREMTVNADLKEKLKQLYNK